MSIVVIGSTSKDRIIIAKQGKDYSQAGGGVYYSSMTLAALGTDVIAIPLLAKRDASMLAALTHPNVTVKPIWTLDTTTYTLSFPQESMDICEKQLHATATGVTWGDHLTRDVRDASAVHISPLSPDEFHPTFYTELRNTFKGLISLDGQGLVRGEHPDFESFLPGTIDILKCDDTEVLQLTHCATEDAAIQKALSWGISEILVTRASRGSTVYHNNEFHTIYAQPPIKIVDATGCGDAYIAGYLYQRTQGHTPVNCAQHASRVAAKNIEHQGAITTL